MVSIGEIEFGLSGFSFGADGDCWKWDAPYGGGTLGKTYNHR